jgi:hypothetical protein
MTASRDPDRLIHAFLLDGAEQLHDQVYDAVRTEIERKRQRVVIGPWRVPDMNKLVPMGLAAAAVILALFAGTRLLGPPAPAGVGGVPTVGPSATPSITPSVSPSVPPSPTATPALPLTESFTSTVHGLSVSYPAEWTARAATSPWTGAGYLFQDPAADFLYDPTLTDHLFLTFASEPIGDSEPDEWVAEQMALDDPCEATEPITVDGAAGLIGAGDCNMVAVTTDGRGYLMYLHTSGDEAWLSTTYDRAWFEEVLATVQLQPEAALDAAPSASP